MSQKLLKGIFLTLGFFFFVEILWMLGANFGIAEPFCLVVGKKSIKCSDDGNLKVVAKQFCLGQDPFGKSKKTNLNSNNINNQQQQQMFVPQGNVPVYQQGAVPPGYVIKENLKSTTEEDSDNED